MAFPAFDLVMGGQSASPCIRLLRSLSLQACAVCLGVIFNCMESDTYTINEHGEVTVSSGLDFKGVRGSGFHGRSVMRSSGECYPQKE